MAFATLKNELEVRMTNRISFYGNPTIMSTLRDLRRT